MSKKTVKTTKNTEATVTAPVTPAPATLSTIVDKPKRKKNAAELATAAAAVIGAKLEAKREATPIATEATSKRITVGARIDQWRVVPSQRKGMPGWFVQGGSYTMLVNGRNAFTVGAETFFEDRKEAAAALAAKRMAAAA
jgi:hypothetical protein